MEIEANGKIKDPAIRGTQGEQDFHVNSDSLGDIGIPCTGRQSLGCDREIASGNGSNNTPSNIAENNRVPAGLPTGTIRRPKPQTHGKALSLHISASEDELADIEEEIRISEEKEVLLSELRNIEQKEKNLLERKRLRLASKAKELADILLSYQLNVSGVTASSCQDATN